VQEEEAVASSVARMATSRTNVHPEEVVAAQEEVEEIATNAFITKFVIK